MTETPKPQPPKPGPIPSPAALRAVIQQPAPAVPPSQSARFGRVADDGTVFVTDGEGEREVGSYPGATPDEALQYFARKYDELVASATLLEQRLGAAEVTVSAKEAREAYAALLEHATEPNVVGDLVALQDQVTRLGVAVEARHAQEIEQRAEAKAAATAQRRSIVELAESVAAEPADRVQWKQAGEQMRLLFDQWKDHQRSGPRLDKEIEAELWQRFSAARTAFDKARRTHFAELDSARSDAKRLKTTLVEEAERLATSRDWGTTARAFKELMGQWRGAGRAARGDDEALWERFKAAQDSFFAAKDEVSAAEDAEYQANLAVKEKLIAEAEALLPIRDLEEAKAALRIIQDKWDAAGRVPRAAMERTEKALRRVESAVRDAQDRRWTSANPEAAARARSLTEQLEKAVESLRKDVAKATASGDAGAIAKATQALQAREQLLEQTRASLAEFGG